MLKGRVKKITGINRKKKALIDQYSKNGSIVEQAFEQIQDSSGISNVEEIVTTFIKAEEQNYSLYNYVNLLGQETDALEDNNNFLDGQLEQYKGLARMNENEKLGTIKHLKEKRQEIFDDIAQSHEESENI